jgi:single-stranded-DNA-specific exonuclease
MTTYATSPAPDCRMRAWRERHADPVVVERLASETGLSRVVARILVTRGLTQADEVRRFLEPDLARDRLASSAVPGMDAAADRVAAAVRAGERIVVFGDFDLDGISSAALATRGLAAMGAQVEGIVPHRFREGYGLTQASVERLAGLAPDLVVTVDCGVSSATEISALRARGIDVVVTDHHEPGEGVPEGIPVADPKLDPGCPACDLAGAGVALMLVEAVGERLGREEVWRGLTDLATLGTVADIVPLIGANRAVVTDGLARMRRDPRPGIAALATVAGSPVDSISSDAIAFHLGPRLNAAGRMADPQVALDLLLTDDPIEAERLARELDVQNRARQSTEIDLTEAALALAEREFAEGDRVLVLAGEGWHEGVKGIVASRLASASVCRPSCSPSKTG